MTISVWATTYPIQQRAARYVQTIDLTFTSAEVVWQKSKKVCRHLRGSNSRTNFVSGVQMIGRRSLICDALRVVIRPLNHSGKMPQAMYKKSKMSDSIGQVTFRYKYPLMDVTTYPTTTTHISAISYMPHK